MKCYYITGGARSGKSSYAQQLALSLSDKPIYVATARKWDEDFQDRINRHQLDRGDQWEAIEEEKELSKIDFIGRVVVIDCVTLWLTNFFVDTKYDIDTCLTLFKKEMKGLQEQEATFIIISNEIGMGVHAESAIGRKFTDLQGWANQHLAKIADEAIFMVSGLPMKLK